MVKKVNIGVLGIQGAVTEHIHSMKQVLKKTKSLGEVFIVKSKDDIKKIDGLIIPGGESTTISRILFESEMYKEIKKRVKNNDLSIMGTCAGCIILAKKLNKNDHDIRLLELVDMQVKRNIFGRQKDSFEHNIKIVGFKESYNAVFIRAPVIEKAWGKCKTLAKIENKIIMARQDNILALSFHPELTDDLRIHKYFLDMILSLHNCQ
jgi:pyridoxal 5'-phosphate synthase pdxT subunit